MNDKWPKLLITCDTTTGTSYWHMKSKKYFLNFCLNWLSDNIQTGYYEHDTYDGSFIQYLSDEYNIQTSDMLTTTAIFDIIGDCYLAKCEWTSKSELFKLYKEALEAYKNNDGDKAYEVLKKYSKIYEHDLLGKNHFELVEYSE